MSDAQVRGARQFASSRYVIPAIPFRNVRLGARSRELRSNESEQEIEDGESGSLFGREKVESEFAESQLLAILLPDHLFERTGTPPPTLRL